MALLTVTTKKVGNIVPQRKCISTLFGGALIKPTVRMFKTLTDAIRNGQVGASFFWR